MYSGAREGKSLHELAPVLLPKSSAIDVLSGKYAETKDPRAELIKMTGNLTHRSAAVGLNELGKSLGDQKGKNDRDRARLLAQLAVAERKGDHEAAARIKDSLASESQGKQVD
jgi:hypothetical protein